jgi:hypothetical protein
MRLKNIGAHWVFPKALAVYWLCLLFMVLAPLYEKHRRDANDYQYQEKQPVAFAEHSAERERASGNCTGCNSRAVIAAEGTASATWWLLWATVALGAFTLATLIATICMSRKTNRGIAKQNAINNRAYVSFRAQWEHDFIDPGHESVGYVMFFTNHGKTIAKNVKIMSGHKWMPLIGIATDAVNPQNAFDAGTVLDMQPSQVIRYRHDWKGERDPADGTYLHIFGQVTYQDAFDVPHYTTFCGFLTSFSSGRPMFNALPYFNRAD